MYVTPQGFRAKTLQEIRAELTEGLKAVFGPTFETAVESPNGHLIGQLSLALASLWQLASEVYASRDPGQAEGVALDWSAALSGLTRKGETPCRVQALLYTESGSSVTIPAGSIARRARGSLDFSLDSAVAIDRGACDELLVCDGGSARYTSYVFNFSFGSVTLYNSGSQSNMAALVAAITAAGGVAGFVPGRTDAIYVRDPDGAVGITGQMPSKFKFSAGALGGFTAVDAGAQTCEAGELDTIPSAVDGWDGVYNWAAGVAGTNTETDNELRIRRERSVRGIQARGTDEAIAAHLLEDVEGVTLAKVISNRTMRTDDDRRPPKSFEALVVGGADADVARCIWDSQPSGIQAWGNTAVEILDGNGDGQIVRFSRPVARYLWLKVSYTAYDEEEQSSFANVKAALMDWAAEEYTMGKDVIPTRALSGLYRVPGIGAAIVEAALTGTPDGVPAYGTWTIPVGPAEYAALAPTRILLARGGLDG